MIPCRDLDSFGIGYFYVPRPDLRTIVVNQLDDEAQGVEAYYQIGVSRSVDLSLDGQWIDSPFGNVDDAWLIGARLDIRF